MPIAMQVATIPADITPVATTITAIAAYIATVLPNVTGLRARRGRISRPYILTPLPHILPDVAAVAA